MVLNINDNNKLINGFQEDIDIEDDLLYPLIKGSDIKKPFIKDTLNKVIVTQNSLNDDTEYIRLKYPKTWAYLKYNSKYLDKRKSIIYKDKPKFSMFGIGDYAFKPYKVAISGFYKKPIFSLILPIDRKPVMLDDTCYYLPYGNFKDAFFSWILLNSEEVKKFLPSIVFLDSKRPYTKEILMRIDINNLLEKISYDKICEIYYNMPKNYMEYEPDEKDFVEYIDSLKSTDKQLNLLRF